MNLKRVSKQLDNIDLARDEAIRALLQPLVQQEFDKVRKHKPHLERILFGNGTFVIVGLKSTEDPWKYSGAEPSHSSRGVWVAKYGWKGPRYMRALWMLCEFATEVALDDVLPSPQEVS